MEICMRSCWHCGELLFQHVIHICKYDLLTPDPHEYGDCEECGKPLNDCNWAYWACRDICRDCADKEGSAEVEDGQEIRCA